MHLQSLAVVLVTAVVTCRAGITCSTNGPLRCLDAALSAHGPMPGGWYPRDRDTTIARVLINKGLDQCADNQLLGLNTEMRRVFSQVNKQLTFVHTNKTVNIYLNSCLNMNFNITLICTSNPNHHLNLYLKFQSPTLNHYLKSNCSPQYLLQSLPLKLLDSIGIVLLPDVIT